MNLQVGAHDRQGYAGQAGPRAHVDDPCIRPEGVGHDRAVQHVPLPQAWHLAGADQPVTDASVREDLGEADREWQSLRKHRSRTRRCGWQSDGRLVGPVMFHVERRFTRGG